MVKGNSGKKRKEIEITKYLGRENKRNKKILKEKKKREARERN